MRGANTCEYRVADEKRKIDYDQESDLRVQVRVKPALNPACNQVLNISPLDGEGGMPAAIYVLAYEYNDR
jgi:hypothetical protein